MTKHWLESYYKLKLHIFVKNGISTHNKIVFALILHISCNIIILHAIYK